MTAWYPWLALGLGLLIGSFLNVVIYRLPAMMMRSVAEKDPQSDLSEVNLWWPPSHCPRCQHAIMPWDNIPLISWLLLGGRCRYCRCAIPALYPLSELVTGIVFFALVSGYFPRFTLIQILFLACFFCLVYTLAVIDINTFLLPDGLVYPLLWLGLAASVLNIIPVSPRDSVMGAIVIGGFTWLLAHGYAWLGKREGLGGGDVKLFTACAAWVGLNHIAELMLGSAVLGVVAFFIRGLPHFRRLNTANPYLPFGPAIAVAALLILHMEVLR
ncbi:A24 family peptidase [Pseudescherichia vulneris]|uniref:prepilin peptidase n=1 Tax=Pseudescherichia vulneris TaxID=566 RepID=UPI00227ABF89|nr:A24 family peptidase [Pseudescherichia vulneris]WAH54300.1 A24 family peptidase [Pseudescherichia vulneris]